MINIHINGDATTCKLGISLTELVSEHTTQDQSVAVAINNDFVPRTQYDHTTINEGDTIDIVVPVGGG